MGCLSFSPLFTGSLPFSAVHFFVEAAHKKVESLASSHRSFSVTGNATMLLVEIWPENGSRRSAEIFYNGEIIICVLRKQPSSKGSVIAHYVIVLVFMLIVSEQDIPE